MVDSSDIRLANRKSGPEEQQDAGDSDDRPLQVDGPRKIHAFKNPDGTINRPWQSDASGKVRFAGITEESLDFTDEEIDLVIKPALDILGLDRVRDYCSEDLLYRCVRGYNNNAPNTDKWKQCGVDFGNHVGAVVEGLDCIMEFRSRDEVQANSLLSRRLPKNETFHELWPMSITGTDVHGHVIQCERLSDIATVGVAQAFERQELLLHITQRQEAVQIIQTKESMRRSSEGGERTYKHVHVIDLQGLSIFQFYKMKNTVLPVFKHLGDQFPNTLWKLFAINSPSVFSTIWGIVKKFIDPETAAKVNILSVSETTEVKRFQEAGIPLDQLPSWVTGGTSTTVTSLKDALEECLREGVSGTQRPVDSVYYPKLPASILDRVNGGRAVPSACSSPRAPAEENQSYEPSTQQNRALVHRASDPVVAVDVTKPLRAPSSSTNHRMHAWLGSLITAVVIFGLAVTGSVVTVGKYQAANPVQVNARVGQIGNLLPLDQMTTVVANAWSSLVLSSFPPCATAMKYQETGDTQTAVKASTKAKKEKKNAAAAAAAAAVKAPATISSAEVGVGSSDATVMVLGYEVDFAAFAAVDAAFVDNKHKTKTEMLSETPGP